MASEEQIAEVLSLAERLGPLVDSLESEHVQKLVPPLQEALVEINGSVWLKHPWVNTFAPFVNQSNEIFKQKFSMMREFLSGRKLDTYLFICVERPWRFSTLERWWHNDKLSVDELRELLPHIWTDTEQPSENYYSPIDLWREVDFATDDADAWEKVPDQFTAYRGGGPNGIAWTLSEKTARYFADRFKSLHENPILLKAEVYKSQVYGYLTARGEEEVILDPGEIEIEEVQR